MNKYSKEDIIRLADENDVEFIRMQFTDIFGQMKNVAITRAQLEKALNNQIMIDGSSIEGFVRIHESDQYLRPDLDSFTILPWRPQHGKVARLICDVYNPDGTPFIGEGSDIDSDCLIIYGHEMHNGTMFGELDRYADAAFAAQKQPINIYTRTEMRTYEVFAAVQTRILGDGEEGYRYYNAAGPLDQAGFDALVGWLKQNALYDTGVTPTFGEQILILSTCSYHTENGRFLVAARRIG